MKIHHKSDPIKRRAKEYPSQGDQLDALWKMVECLRDRGIDIGPDADTMLRSVTGIKEKFYKG